MILGPLGLLLIETRYLRVRVRMAAGEDGIRRDCPHNCREKSGRKSLSWRALTNRAF